MDLYTVQSGAHDWTRTSDISLTKGVLYRLSYAGLSFCILERVMGIEPTSSAWKAEVLPLNYTRKPWRFPSRDKWWRGQDSNLRRLSQQIYSLPSLTA